MANRKKTDTTPRRVKTKLIRITNEMFEFLKSTENQNDLINRLLENSKEFKHYQATKEMTEEQKEKYKELKSKFCKNQNSCSQQTQEEVENGRS